MILGTETKTAGRRLARYVAGLVLVVLERDGARTPRALERPVAEAFDTHGMKLARDAGCQTATEAAYRHTAAVCRELCGAGFIHNVSVGAERWELNAGRVHFANPISAAEALGVGRSSVRRWVERWMVAQAPTGRVSLWRGRRGEFFPARAPLPKQGELELPAGSPTASGPMTNSEFTHAAWGGDAAKALGEPVEPPVPDSPVSPGAGWEWVPDADPTPETPWTVTTCETARFEVDNVRVVAERGGECPTVGYEPDEDGFCLCDADPAAVLRYARMLEAAALWALGGEL